MPIAVPSPGAARNPARTRFQIAPAVSTRLDSRGRNTLVPVEGEVHGFSRENTRLSIAGALDFLDDEMPGS